MKYIKGDLIKLSLEKKFDVIVHGCNCFNTMGAGIAVSIKNNFKEAYLEDQKTISGDKNKLGNYTFYNYENLTVINAYTQYGFMGSNNNPPLDYDAVRNCFKKINKNYQNKTIGIPLIGAGLAGGDWKKIEKIINEETKNTNIICVLYEE